MRRSFLVAAVFVLMAGVVMPVHAQQGQITTLKQANTPEKLKAYRAYLRQQGKADAANQEANAKADAAADKALNAQEQAAMKAQRQACMASMKNAKTPADRKTAMDGCRKNEQGVRKRLSEAEQAARKQRMAQRKQQRTAR